jgi:hypothetical protein
MCFSLCINQTPNDGQTWLMNEITSYNDKKDEDIWIPRGRNNTELKLEHLNDDQFKVAFLILRKIREWINLLDQTPSKRRVVQELARVF